MERDDQSDREIVADVNWHVIASLMSAIDRLRDWFLGQRNLFCWHLTPQNPSVTACDVLMLIIIIIIIIHE